MNTTTELDIGIGRSGRTELVMGLMAVINKAIDGSFMICTLPICFATLFLNTNVIILLRKKERTIVNQLMSIECIVNILYSLLGTFQQSPYYRGLHLELYCYAHLALANLFAVFNRLLPVAIVVYR